MESTTFFLLRCVANKSKCCHSANKFTDTNSCLISSKSVSMQRVHTASEFHLFSIFILLLTNEKKERKELKE